LESIDVLELLNERPNQIFPIVFGLSGQFGMAVSKSISEAKRTSIEKRVFQEVDLVEIDSALEGVDSPQRAQAIMPTKLKKPAWAIAALSITNTSKSDFDKFLDATQGMDRFAGIHIDSDSVSFLDAKKLAQDLVDAGVFVWLLSTYAKECRHPLPDLAAAFTEMILGGWRRHRDPKSPNIRESLNIHGSSEIFTLGIGRLAPDIQFHAKSYAPTIAEGTWIRLNQDSSPNPIPTPSIGDDLILEAVAGLLPNSAFAHGPRQTHGSLLSSTLDSRLGVSALSKPRFTMKTLERRRLKAYLTWLQEIDGFFELIESPAIDKAVAKKSHSFSIDLRSEFLAALKMPEVASGLVWFYRQVLSRWEELFTHLGGIENATPEPSTLGSDIRRIQVAEGRIPAPGGIALRSALVAITFLWIFLGAHMWTGSPWPWEDPLLGWVAIVAGVGVLAVPIFGVLGYYNSMKRCLKLIQKARLGIFRRHVYRNLEHLSATIRGLGKESIAILDSHQGAFNNMVDSLSPSPYKPSKEDNINQAPAFPAGSLDSAISEHLPDAIDRVLARLPGAITSTSVSQDDPMQQWSVEVWEEAIGSISRQEAMSVVSDLSFLDAVSASNASPGHCASLTLDATRHPALPEVRSAPPPPAFLFAPASWDWQNKSTRAQLLGSFDRTIVIATDGRRDLMAVTSIPVPGNWGSTQQEGD
jgi:hypothetical protein